MTASLVAGQPHGAAGWFPVNDHPRDKAAYTFRVTVPAGLEAVANGVLASRDARNGGWTTWIWNAPEPMASYLATATSASSTSTRTARAASRYWDAVDPDLFDAPAPRAPATQFAISQAADSSYKRLSRTISVPAGGAQLSFWVNRDTEQDWDFFFVEAHTPGHDDWTTLPDANGHTSQDTGYVLPVLGSSSTRSSRTTRPTTATARAHRPGTTGEW